MDTMSAFMRGEAAKGSPQRVFDWDKAARILKERGATDAEAGLSEDWEYTGDAILRDGKPVPEADTNVYLSSNWATPMLNIDGETIECWLYAKSTPGWDSGTYWPDSAIAILNGTPTDLAIASTSVIKES